MIVWIFKKLLPHFFPFIGSFCHHLQAFPKGWPIKPLKMEMPSLYVIRKWWTFDLHYEACIWILVRRVWDGVSGHCVTATSCHWTAAMVTTHRPPGQQSMVFCPLIFGQWTITHLFHCSCTWWNRVRTWPFRHLNMVAWLECYYFPLETLVIAWPVWP